MRGWKLIFLLIFALATGLQAKASVAIVDEMLFSSFQKVEAKRNAAPVNLIGVRFDHQFSELGLYTEYLQATSPSQFFYSIDTNTFDNKTYFNPRHFDMWFESQMRAGLVGLRLEQTVGELDFGCDLGLGLAQYQVRFPNQSISSDDKAVVYSGNSVVCDFGLTVSEMIGPMKLSFTGGYFFANAGQDSLKAQDNYKILSYTPGPDVSKGSTLYGTLDYSGFKLGLSIGTNF
jgi:hypothetical protein